MALDYYLTIQNPKNEVEPEQVRESLVSIFFLQSNQPSDILVAPGLSLNVFKEGDESEESPFGTLYPDVCVAFRIDKFSQYEKGINTMLKMVVWLMSFFNEDVVLLSMSAKLSFNEFRGN